MVRNGALFAQNWMHLNGILIRIYTPVAVQCLCAYPAGATIRIVHVPREPANAHCALAVSTTENHDELSLLETESIAAH